MSRRALALAAIAGLIVGACTSSDEPNQPEIIIASDFPVGPDNPNIQATQDAIQLAVNDNPNVGGYRLGYAPYSDALSGRAWPEKGIQNLKSMLARANVLGMVGPGNSYMTIEEIPRASAKNLVMLSPSATNLCLTVAPLCDTQIESARANAPVNFFRIAPPDPAQGTAMANFVAQLHVRRVAAINIWHPPAYSDGDPYIAAFRRELSARGGELVLPVAEKPFPTHDYTTFLAQAKLAGAEAIYAVGSVDGGICDIRSQMKADFKYLLLTDGATNDDNCLKLPASVPTFGTFAAVNAVLSSDAGAKEIVARFHKAYPQVQLDDFDVVAYTFAAYDCARILITAIGRAIDANGGGVPTRLDVLRQVAKGEFDGGATGNYRFLPTGDAVSPMMSIWGVKDNQWYYIDRLDASAST